MNAPTDLETPEYTGFRDLEPDGVLEQPFYERYNSRLEMPISFAVAVLIPIAAAFLIILLITLLRAEKSVANGALTVITLLAVGIAVAATIRGPLARTTTASVDRHPAAAMAATPTSPGLSCVDDIAFLPAMVARSNVHGPATFMQNTGFVLPGFPSMGAWISYGLGSLSHNLPAFVVLPDARGFAPNGPANWSAGFLPASFQGTLVRASERNLDEAAHFLQFFFLDPLERIEIFHFAGDGAIKCSRIEMRDRPNPADAGDEVLPAFLCADAQCAD